MNKNKRAFLKMGVALMVTTSLSPLAALAGRDDGVELLIQATDGKEESEGILSLSKDEMGKLQDLQGQKRAGFLAELIMRWLKKRFPDIPWPKVGDDMGKDLTQQMNKMLESNGLGGEGAAIRGIKIRVKVNFKPPNKWEISLQIDF
ncbi:MAG TPA: hypothetical protein ENK28_12785 [Aliiroseovarius sp.]|nr:hypothetical protein [Aliiroseovarius sp.]